MCTLFCRERKSEHFEQVSAISTREESIERYHGTPRLVELPKEMEWGGSEREKAVPEGALVCDVNIQLVKVPSPLYILIIPIHLYRNIPCSISLPSSSEAH